ncbi:hypothetical protein [Granulicella sp. S190]|uniref:hypothetical protein n=1 Tax=Granulicella sp. S190 TaxID=1747226 RepID=UPI001C20B733|nr:hypothetical protein [Granulicella sp. S190]
MTDEQYKLVEATPSSDDYRRLRIAAGLSPKSAEAAAAGLPNTIYAVVVRNDGVVVGMGRIIGDGGLFFQIVDIATQSTRSAASESASSVLSSITFTRPHFPAPT